MDFINLIQKIHPLPPHEVENLLQFSEEIAIVKNTVIIEADKTSKYIYFLKKGICRIYYPKFEKEIILDFAFPGEAIISLNSYIHDIPGYEYVETLEECVLQRISIHRLQLLFKQSLPIANWGRKMAEIETLKIEKRLMQHLFNTASVRYKDLIERAPSIIHYIKLGHIASYLGVSQVTLSRIRSEIK